jgi:hypothetical protein
MNARTRSDALHVPLPHVATSPPGHWLAHLPQFAKSFVVSTHAVPQVVFGALHGEEHAPLAQFWPVVHAWPHAPQFLGSVARSTHAPPHVVCPHGAAVSTAVSVLASFPGGAVDESGDGFGFVPASWFDVSTGGAPPSPSAFDVSSGGASAAPSAAQEREREAKSNKAMLRVNVTPYLWTRPGAAQRLNAISALLRIA